MSRSRRKSRMSTTPSPSASDGGEPSRVNPSAVPSSKSVIHSRMAGGRGGTTSRAAAAGRGVRRALGGEAPPPCAAGWGRAGGGGRSSGLWVDGEQERGGAGDERRRERRAVRQGHTVARVGIEDRDLVPRREDAAAVDVAGRRAHRRIGESRGSRGEGLHDDDVVGDPQGGIL